jgi:hypothetical protein
VSECECGVSVTKSVVTCVIPSDMALNPGDDKLVGSSLLWIQIEVNGDCQGIRVK